jgi:hypothetical protein
LAIKPGDILEVTGRPRLRVNLGSGGEIFYALTLKSPVQGVTYSYYLHLWHPTIRIKKQAGL